MKHVARWALLFTVLLLARNWIHGKAELIDQGHATASGATGAVVQAVDVLISGPAALVVFLFSRIPAQQVLRHDTRTRIRELIAARPGLGLSDVAAELQLGWGTTVYHVNRLEQAGLLVSSSAGRRRALFVPEHNRITRDALTLLSTATQIRLLERVQRHPGSSQRQIADAAGISLPLANRYLQRLESEGLVASEKTWRTRSYRPTDALPEFLGEHAERQKSKTFDHDESASAASSIAPPRGTRAH